MTSCGFADVGDDVPGEYEIRGTAQCRADLCGDLRIPKFRPRLDAALSGLGGEILRRINPQHLYSALMKRTQKCAVVRRYFHDAGLGRLPDRGIPEPYLRAGKIFRHTRGSWTADAGNPERNCERAFSFGNCLHELSIEPGGGSKIRGEEDKSPHATSGLSMS